MLFIFEIFYFLFFFVFDSLFDWRIDLFEPQIECIEQKIKWILAPKSEIKISANKLKEIRVFQLVE